MPHAIHDIGIACASRGVPTGNSRASPIRRRPLPPRAERRGDGPTDVVPIGKKRPESCAFRLL